MEQRTKVTGDTETHHLICLQRGGRLTRWSVPVRVLPNAPPTFFSLFLWEGGVCILPNWNCSPLAFGEGFSFSPYPFWFNHTLPRFFCSSLAYGAPLGPPPLGGPLSLSRPLLGKPACASATRATIIHHPSLTGQSSSRPRSGGTEGEKLIASKKSRPSVIHLCRISWKTWIANSYWVKEDGQGWPRRFLGRSWSGRVRSWSLLARNRKSVLCPILASCWVPATSPRSRLASSITSPARLRPHRFPTGTRAGDACRASSLLRVASDPSAAGCTHVNCHRILPFPPLPPHPPFLKSAQRQ
ncbi:hypothetical protein VUR80DRAFT_6584 [Thermomyces stellatus]